jgi:hypothetical protein
MWFEHYSDKTDRIKPETGTAAAEALEDMAIQARVAKIRRRTSRSKRSRGREEEFIVL